MSRGILTKREREREEGISTHGMSDILLAVNKIPRKGQVKLKL